MLPDFSSQTYYVHTVHVCLCLCSESWMKASLSILSQAVVLLKVLFILKEICPLHCHMFSLRHGRATLMVVGAKQFFFDGGVQESKDFRLVKTPPIVVLVLSGGYRLLQRSQLK